MFVLSFEPGVYRWHMVLSDFRFSKPKVISTVSYKHHAAHPTPRRLRECHEKTLGWLRRQQIDWENTIITCVRVKIGNHKRFHQELGRAMTMSQILTAIYMGGGYNSDMYAVSDAALRTLIGGDYYASTSIIYKFVKRAIDTQIRNKTYLKCLAHALVGYRYGINWKSQKGIVRLSYRTKRNIPNPVDRVNVDYLPSVLERV